MHPWIQDAPIADHADFQEFAMDGGTIKVLLIEDDEDDYVLIRDLLSEVKNTEYVIEWVRSYDEASKRMACPEALVCLMDYRLGGL
jgi:CheY-like chemotaxis protein